jgi:hypothetical protein
LELLRFTKTHNRHREALARATGEHFNIFTILGIRRREVTTHSPVLAELLNPKGNHGQGAAFLQLFLGKIGINKTEFDAENSTVKREYDIGPVTEETGGKIDILIRDDNGKMILIENKIDAVDQENQMKRYYNFAQKYSSQFYLFYLTLDGHKPSNLSEDDLNRIKCKRITYKGEILTWLNDCRKESACLPNVRETITQYIHLIEELTNQTTNILMSKELIDEIVRSKESLLAYHTLCDGALWFPVHTELIITRLDSKLKEIAKANNLEMEGSPCKLHEEWGGFYFKSKGLTQRNLKIFLGYETSGYNNFFFGFSNDNPDKPCPITIASGLLSAFKEQFPSLNPDNPNPRYYPVSAYLEKQYRDWGPEVIEAIYSDQFVDNLKEKLEKLAKIANEICPDEAIT